jgi:hypothetical protein
VQVSQAATVTAESTGPPPWVVPVGIIVVVLFIGWLGTKKDEAIENPIVDIIVLAFGVFAVAALFRLIGNKASAPGLASFFGGAPQANAAHSPYSAYSS